MGKRAAAASAALLTAAMLLVCGCMAPKADVQPANKTAKSNFTVLGGNRTNQTLRNATISPPNITLTNVGQTLFTWEPYSCNYTNRPSLAVTMRSEMWMDRGRYRTDISYSNRHDRTHVVSDGESIYIWTDNVPVGQKYDLSDIRGLMGQVNMSELASNRTVPINTDTMDIIGAENVTCRPQYVNWSLFAPPKNLQFKKALGVYDTEYDSKLDRYAKAWEKPAA
jgi:hypothetical protein